MKEKFLPIIKTIIIIALGIISVDFFVGRIGDKVLSDLSTTGTRAGQINYLIKKATADVIIIGSSRACRHYNAPMMQSDLGMSVYNASVDAADFIHNSCVLHSILERRPPKIVIFDVQEKGLLEGSNKRFIVDLNMYYYSDDYIKKTINCVDGKYTPIKMKLNSYRFNSVAPKILYALISQKERPLGYAPITWNNHVPVTLEHASTQISKIDSLNYYRFLEIINWSRIYGFKLIVIDSPRLLINPNNNKIISEECKKNDIIYFDNSNLDFFMNNPSLFSDMGHLSSNGADLYTKFLIEQIGPYVVKKDK